MNRKNHFLFRLLLLVTVMLQDNPIFSQDTIPKKDTVHPELIPHPEYGLQDSCIVKGILLDSYTLICPIRSYVSNPGLQIEKPDSIQQSRYNAGTLTDLLGQNGITCLKSYGGGSLATTAIRGASESQTPVLWNGINIQSPTNGNLDLSLMPSILFDVVSLQNGGGSAGWGSGAIGGVIQTGSAGTYNEGWRIKYSGQFGSFGEADHGLKFGYSNSRFYSDVRAYRQVAANNFTYRNLGVNGNPVDTLGNAYFFQQGAQAQIGWPTPLFRNQFVLRSWYQQSDRGIAPSMLEANANAYQKDEFSRSMADWKLSLHGFRLEMKSALLTEYMNYYLGYHVPNSFTHALSAVNDADCRIEISDKLSSTFGLSDTWSKAYVTQYLPLKMQNRASAYAALQYLPTQSWNLVLNFRDEEVDGKTTPLVGSFGAEWSRIRFITLKTSVSRNYRIPTFNDLYWSPGGNPDLKPEDSWNEDGSVVFKYTKNKFILTYSVTAYYRITKNWILWQPTSNPLVWSPENLLEVWSRGVEHRLNVKWSRNKLLVNFIGGYDYVRATNEKSKNPYDVSIGKQLPYVPANHFYGMVQFTYRKFYLSYMHQFNGLRFTASDHSTYLPAFDLADVTVGKRIDYKQSCGDLFFRINNLFDKEYQAIQWRPMPGRNFEIGITIDFDKPKKTDTSTQP